MFAYHDAGFTAWDLADHYGPAEDFVGSCRRQFAARYGAERLAGMRAFTKWVPRPARMTRRAVEEPIGISLARMGVDCLDLLQFHWWDYANESYLDALGHLADLLDYVREDGAELCIGALARSEVGAAGAARLSALFSVRSGPGTAGDGGDSWSGQRLPAGAGDC